VKCNVLKLVTYFQSNGILIYNYFTVSAELYIVKAHMRCNVAHVCTSSSVIHRLLGTVNPICVIGFSILQSVRQ
jgi:hypothetical protein